MAYTRQPFGYVRLSVTYIYKILRQLPREWLAGYVVKSLDSPF